MGAGNKYQVSGLKYQVVCFLILVSCYLLPAQNNSAFINQKTKLQLLPVKENNNVNLSLSPLKHEAFFCKMEDKVYSKLNVWITLRAGNDDLYRKLIAAP